MGCSHSFLHTNNLPCYCTGKVDYLLPIIFTTVCAKWVGDKLNEGIYHTLHAVKGIPFLGAPH
eukprot:COSAG03_NODE_1926_length_3349_cov_16.360308_4_plen_63_part_00